MKLDEILRWILLGIVFLTPFIALVVGWGLMFPYVSGKVMPFRFLVGSGFAIWAGLAVIRPEFRVRWSPILAAFGVFVLVIGLAAAWGVDPYRSFWGNLERMEGVVFYVHALAYFLLLISVLNTQKLWRAFWHVNMLVGSIVALWGIFQVFTDGGRVYATLGNPIYLGGYSLLLFYLGLYLWYKSGSWFFGLWYGSFSALQLLVMFLTATRGAAVGFLVGSFLVLCLVAALLRDNVYWRKMAIGSLVGLAVLAGGLYAMSDTSFVENNRVLSRLTDISLESRNIQARFMTWEKAWQGFTEKPVLGWGPDNFVFIFSHNYNPDMFGDAFWFDRSHNVFLDWLSTAGILGFLSYLAVWLAAIYYLWRKSQNEPLVGRIILTGLLVGYLIQNFFVFDNASVFMLITAVLAYIHFLGRSEESYEPEEGRLMVEGKVKIKAVVAISIILLIVIWANGPVLVDNYRLARARDHSNRQEIDMALVENVLADALGLAGSNDLMGAGTEREIQSIINAVEEAKAELAVGEEDQVMKTVSLFGQPMSFMVTRDHFNDNFQKSLDLYRQIFKRRSAAWGEAATHMRSSANEAVLDPVVDPELKEQFVSETIDNLKMMLELSPENPRYLFFLGRFYSSQEEWQPALEYLEKAREISPERQAILFELAMANYELGNEDEALDLTQKSFEVAPQFDEPRKFYGLTALQTGDRELAEEILLPEYGTLAIDDDRFFEYYVQAGEYELMAEILKKRIGREPDNVHWRESLAATFYSLGKIEEAVNVLKEFAEESLHYPEARAEEMIRAIETGQLVVE